MKDIVILGSGGQGKDVLLLLEEHNEVSPEWNILGFVDNVVDKVEVDGYPILGGDDWLLNYPRPICVAVALGTSRLRKRVIEKYRNASHVTFPPIISRHAHVSKRATIGMGSVIACSSIVMSDVSIGDFVLVNYDSTVGHDSVIKDFVTLNPSCNISGNVTVESSTDIGTGAQVIQGLHIGTQSIVGAGSVIISDVPDYCTVVGNPGHIVTRN